MIFETLELALSGGGTLYVYYKNYAESDAAVEVVDKENGRVVRTLDTSEADNNSTWSIHAHENVLLVVEWTRGLYKSVHVYENEILKRSLQVLIRFEFNISPVLCGREYLLLLLDKTRLAILDLNQSGSEVNFKSIQLDQMTGISSLVWVARGDEQKGEGYLFASDRMNNAFDSHVYELNVKSVEDGALLKPLHIPFMNSYGSINVYFHCTMGTDAIFCTDLCGKNGSEFTFFGGSPVNILKLEKIIHH